MSDHTRSAGEVRDHHSRGGGSIARPGRECHDAQAQGSAFGGGRTRGTACGIEL